MKNKIYLALLIAFVAGFYFVNSKSQAAPAPTVWEYKIETKCSDEKRLNTLGAEGWELAGFGISETGMGGNWRCVLKRAK